MRSLRLARPDAALLLTLVVHVGVRALYGDVVPMYDSRQYFDQCAVPYLAAPLNLLGLNCFGHPSLALMAVVALGQAIDLGSTYLLHASTTLLGVASIVAFHRLCGHLMPAPELLWERRLLVALYGLGAHCLALGINFNPDYGVLTYFVLLLERVLAGHFPLIALWGSCLLLSKEPGLLLYGVVVGSFALHVWIRPRTLPPPAQLVRACAWLAAPLAVFATVKVLEHLYDMPLLWGGKTALAPILVMFTSLELLDPVFLTYSFDILGLGFAWILGLPVLAMAALLTLRAIAARPGDPVAGFDARSVRILLTVFGLCFLLLTRFKTYNNVRYFAPLYPLLVATAGYALCSLGVRVALRRLLLALALLCCFSFNFHSRDPVSQAFFGTFRFGEHEMLRMAVRDPCCGYGRDQLVYNLQFTELHYLQNEVYRALRPQPDTVLVGADLVDYFFSGRVDTHSYERTLRFDSSHEIHIEDVSQLLTHVPLPEHVHFLVFPNFDNRPAYGRLGEHYREVAQRTFRHGGYELLVHALELKR